MKLSRFVTNIELPTSLVGYEGLTIEWTATGDIIDTATGAVTHPLSTSDLTLTATCKRYRPNSRSWLLTVFGTNTDALTTVHTLDLEDADPNSTYGISPTKSKYDVPETNNMVSLGNPIASGNLKIPSLVGLVMIDLQVYTLCVPNLIMIQLEQVESNYKITHLILI